MWYSRYAFLVSNNPCLCAGDLVPSRKRRSNMSNFAELVAKELNKARTKHPGKQRSVHEGYAVILEEVDEFWDLVKEQAPTKDAMLKELVQIAAMAQRTAEDLSIIEEQV